jgi:hypothetical protein
LTYFFKVSEQVFFVGKIFTLVFLLTMIGFMAAASPAAAGGLDNYAESFEHKYDLLRQANFRSLTESAPAAGEAGRPFTLVMVPAYHQNHHQDLQTTIDGTRLKSRSGTSRLGSFILTYTNPVNEYLSFGWIYQYTFGKYKGGLLVPNDPIFDGHSDLKLSSHMTGILGDIFLGQAGHISWNFLVAWDSFSGNETMITPAGRETRQVDRRDTRLGSVTVWWERPFNLNEELSLSPYAGWRTVRACLRGMAVWTEPVGTTSTQNAWSHIVSGGLTMNYKPGPVSLKLWSGVNHKITKGNTPGFASRAISPGVATLGWMNNWNRTVWTFGFGLSRPISDGFILNVSYDGHRGPDTLSQAGSLAAVWIF